VASLLALVLLAGCASDRHEPPFVRRHYQPFARAEAIAITLREWRLFGQPIDDDPQALRPEAKPERQAGLWERVGEYWFLGQDAGAREGAWTGKHDANGTEFPAGEDGDYAWSAAFVSYVMRVAGAGDRFPYSAAHADYIDVAKDVTDGTSSGPVVSAQRPARYAPQPGDLICLGRGASRGLTYDDLPASLFPSHCDIVVASEPGRLAVIGGNVDDAVTMKHVPVNAAGLLQDPGGEVVDTRYPWFVVLKVAYDR